MKKKLFFILAFTVFTSPIMSQVDESSDSSYIEETYEEEESNLVEETFMSSRVISGHSVEMLRKGVLEFRVEHRFGDIAGTDGGVQTLFGLIEIFIHASNVDSLSLRGFVRRRRSPSSAFENRSVIFDPVFPLVLVS